LTAPPFINMFKWKR